MKCANCNSIMDGNYCSNCGNSLLVKKINKQYIIHEVEHLFHFERGFFYTAMQLLIQPGHCIREYIQVNRLKHMKPVTYLILTSILYTIVAHYTHADQIYNSKEKLQFGDSSINDIQHWIQTHYGYANILLSFFIAIFIRLIYKKYEFNFFEIVVLMCYIMGQIMLIFTFEAFFIKWMSTDWFMGIIGAITLIYPTWTIGQFYDAKKVSSYIKALIAYGLGYLAFWIAIIVIGLSIDKLIAFG